MSPENPDDDPITPEVVDRGGASSRKRRVTGARGAGDAGAPPPGTRPVRASNGGIFRIGCMALIAIGLLGILYGGRQAVDPEGTQCSYARQSLDDANERDVEDWEHVPLPEGVEEADDLECTEAVALAGDLPDEEEDSLCGQAREAIEDDGLPDGIDDAGDIPCDEVGELTANISGFDPTPPSGDFISDGQIRGFGLVVGLVGVAQAAGAFFLLRTRARRARTVALAGAALGILTGGGGIAIFGMLILVFVVYALAFSADARNLFPPNPAGGGFLRPRMPKQPPPSE